MAKKNFHIPETEILFILGSTKDTRGRRVLVKCEGVENTVYPETLKDTKILALIGIEAKELILIQEFFNSKEISGA